MPHAQLMEKYDAEMQHVQMLHSSWDVNFLGLEHWVLQFVVDGCYKYLPLHITRPNAYLMSEKTTDFCPHTLLQLEYVETLL